MKRGNECTPAPAPKWCPLCGKGAVIDQFSTNKNDPDRFETTEAFNVRCGCHPAGHTMVRTFGGIS